MVSLSYKAIRVVSLFCNVVRKHKKEQGTIETASPHTPQTSKTVELQNNELLYS